MKRIFSVFFKPKSTSNFVILLVFILSVDLKDESSTKINCCFFKYSADNTAKRRSFLLIFLFTVLGFGPKLTPPPFQRGERDEPALAFPVPFCFHGFLPPPRTSDFVLVDAKYLREFFICVK